MDVVEQARRLSFTLAEIDARMPAGPNDREVYEFLDQFGKEFDVVPDLIDMRNLTNYRWVIPLMNHTGIAVVAVCPRDRFWKVYEAPAIPEEIDNEVMRAERSRQQSA